MRLNANSNGTAQRHSSRVTQCRLQPFPNGFPQLFDSSRKEVIHVLHDQPVHSLRAASNHFPHFAHVPMLIVRAVHKKFRFCACLQIGKVRIVHRRANSDQLFHSSIFAAGPQSHPASKTKARQQERRSWKFLRQKIQCCSNIVALAFAAVIPPSLDPAPRKLNRKTAIPSASIAFAA